MNFFAKPFVACLILFSLGSHVQAKLIYQTASTPKKFAPNSATDIPMLAFTLNSDGADINVNKFRIKNASNSVRFGLGVSAVHLYRDEGVLGVLEEGTDSEIVSLPTLTSGAAPEQTLSFTNELVSSANQTNRDTKSFLITYDLDPSKGQSNLLGTANITLLDIETTDSAQNLDLVSEAINPTINSVTITGVRFLTVLDLAPSVVLPGQKQVKMFAISMAVVGENITPPSEATFTLYNEKNNLVTTSGQSDGVVKASMYFSETPPPEGVEFAINDPPKIVKTGSDPGLSFRSKSTFDFKFPPYITGTSFQNFNGSLNGITQNFYIFYDIGDDIPVTAETKVSAQLIEFKGFGVNSNLALTWPLQGQELFSASEVLVAGMSLESITSLIPRSTVFGVRNKIPMLKLRLRANHSSATLNAVTIVNSGSVPFQTTSSGKTNIVRVELFEDSNGDGELSQQDDVRIGNVLLGSKDSGGKTVNEATLVNVPIVQETSPTVNGLLIKEFNTDETYPRNEEKIIFAVYESGEVINGGLDASGNITRVANASLGKVSATAILELDSEDVTTNIVTLSGISNTKPRSSSPIAAVEFNQGANVSVASVTDISPEASLQGEIFVPMLSVNLVADRTFTATNISIFNESKSFLSDNSGVTKVWIYKDFIPFGVFDGSDVFLGATSTFLSRDQAVVSDIPLSLGDNNLLVLYSIGQDDRGSLTDLISEGVIKAQFKGVTSLVDNETLVLSGLTPVPEIPASVDVFRTLIQDINIDAPSVEDSAITFNVKLHFSNPTESDITLENVALRVYLSKLSGPDITYEFSSTYANGKVTTIPAGESVIQTFSMRHSNALTEGIGVIDAQIQYLAAPSTSILISRYLGSDGFRSAAAKARTISIQKNVINYEWVFPAYIETIQYVRGSDVVPFSEGMALRASDILQIKFKEKGAFIDSSSLQIFRNGIRLFRSDLGLSTTDSFSYDDTSGIITIENIGDKDGAIQLFVADGTNSLAPLSITYAISNTVKIIRPLFFPNPYPLGFQDLTLGFNLTQPSTVDFYFFNYIGVEVFRTSETYSKTGYNTLSISKTSKTLSQGVYLCKMVATDTSGNTSIALVKLSVY